MRRRFRKKKKFLFIFLIYIVLLALAGVSYALLTTSLNIKGKITGTDINSEYSIAPGSIPYLTINKFRKNRWQDAGLEKTQYEFYVKNKGNETYDNFVLTITFQYNISDINIWNYDYTLSNNILVITNYNYTLKPNDEQVVNFIVGSTIPNNRILSIKLEVSDDKEEIDLRNFLIVFSKTSGWGNYVYQYDVKITNKTGKRVNGWELKVTLPKNTSYINGWNAVYEVQGNTVIIKNASHNGRIDNNQTITIGLQLQTDIINFVPVDVKVNVW